MSKPMSRPLDEKGVLRKLLKHNGTEAENKDILAACVEAGISQAATDRVVRAYIKIAQDLRFIIDAKVRDI